MKCEYCRVIPCLDVKNGRLVKGVNLRMTRAIADAVHVPVIASGGAGTLMHLKEAVVDGHADAVLVASIAHFGTFTIRQMKEYLASQGIPVRL